MSFAAPSEQIDFLSSARSGSYVLFCLFPSSSSPKVDFSAVEKVELGVAANIHFLIQDIIVIMFLFFVDCQKEKHICIESLKPGQR
jgi:hypothetical protein